MTVLLALGAALCYGTSDFAGGLAARRRRPAPVLLVAQGVATALLTAGLPLVTSHPTTLDLLAGAAAGLCAATGSLCLYAALARGPMSTVAPLTAILVAALPVTFALATGERLGPTAWAGIPLALVATALIARPAGTTGPHRPHRSSLLHATASGAAFAGFFVLLSRPAPASGLSPLAAAYLTATAVLASATIVVRGQPSKDRTAFPWRLSLTAGVTELAAHLCYQYAVRGGLLGIAAVLTALYPAATTLLARCILHEHPSRAQLAGYPLALAAITLLTLARPA
ncbi:EamA family transporter [Streptomyces eurythermus]|uniref:EamA family transporter n=1 Tax=Streptomyces eurythermus TaxID=42237 RepID=UPI0036D360CC